MTSASQAVDLPKRPIRTSGLWYRLRGVVSILVAIALALTPVTAILVLGWLMRMMRRETAINLCRHAQGGIRRRDAKDSLAAVETLAPLSRFPGWMRGLKDTARSGLRAAVALAAATLPYGLVLLLAWWAGWENSFNKGYEQAWVGPLVSVLGIALGVFVLIHLPMGLAHHAAEQRIGAIWELRIIRQLIRHVRWRYVLLTLLTIVLSVPLFLAQILPTFIENINPQLATAAPEEIRRFAFLWHLGFTTYLVLMLMVIRRWAGRLYARAIVRQGAFPGAFSEGVLEALVLPKTEAQKPPGRVGGLISTALLVAGWFAFIAALYVAQFANHAWWNWLNQPAVGLPWVYRAF